MSLRFFHESPAEHRLEHQDFRFALVFTMVLRLQVNLPYGQLPVGITFAAELFRVLTVGLSPIFNIQKCQSVALLSLVKSGYPKQAWCICYYSLLRESCIQCLVAIVLGRIENNSNNFTRQGKGRGKEEQGVDDLTKILDQVRV